MDKRDRGILVGMSLGDGCIRPRRKQASGKMVAPQIYIGHGMRQLDYLEHKAELLRSIFGGTHSVRIGHYAQKALGGKVYTMCYLTKSNPYFETLHGMLYKFGRKTYSQQILDMLTPEGVAIWYMDDGSIHFQYRVDGSISGCSFRIATYCPEEQADLIVTHFANAFGIAVRKHYCKKTDAYTISGNTTAFAKFKALIDPYVIPSMRYKLEPVATPNGHERRAPEGVCGVCSKQVNKTVAGKCMSCYQKAWHDSRHGDRIKICSGCGKEAKLRHFRGDICAACYQRKRKYGDDIVRASENEESEDQQGKDLLGNTTA